MKLALKTIVLEENFHELELMREITEEFGVDFRYDGSIWPRLNGDQSTWDHQVDVDKLLELDVSDVTRKEAWEKARKKAGDSILRNENIFACNAAIRTFHIDAWKYECVLCSATSRIM